MDLGALSSAAAAARDGFAVVRHGRTATDRAFARGLCFGAPAAGCLACLSTAARDVAVGCSRGANSRRAGVWCHGCFLAYADTDAPSACEDAFRSWFYTAVQNTKVRRGGECTGDRVAADCGRCFEDSARAAAALGRLPRLRGEEVVVEGYSCCLRVQRRRALEPLQGAESRRFRVGEALIVVAVRSRSLPRGDNLRRVCIAGARSFAYRLHRIFSRTSRRDSQRGLC
ncbi:hypothetical protein BAE44_0022565 [Dichanthelium oligosanthes]|uniref:Gnk2-homologous domain-containing protein n=1 Tax=Dichanthelium oligosanthes TaxID=888268 RepID=A0A1E5UUD5_9POAL|nr:hypothetical protein BAE44_0022565 [Dichanthelium oligosanthes]